jgi:type IV pilus assembly protein PilA
MIVVVLLGLLVAIAVPAFAKVRQASQESSIQNNLRLFASAAQQYMLETGEAKATYDDVVGKGKYMRDLVPIAGENYRELVVTHGSKRLSITSGAVTVNYDF